MYKDYNNSTNEEEGNVDILEQSSCIQLKLSSF